METILPPFSLRFFFYSQENFILRNKIYQTYNKHRNAYLYDLLPIIYRDNLRQLQPK